MCSTINFFYNVYLLGLMYVVFLISYFCYITSFHLHSRSFSFLFFDIHAQVYSFFKFFWTILFYFWIHIWVHLWVEVLWIGFNFSKFHHFPKFEFLQTLEDWITKGLNKECAHRDNILRITQISRLNFSYTIVVLSNFIVAFIDYSSFKPL
jgi:hypothetical protein